MSKVDRINRFMHDALFVEVELFDDVEDEPKKVVKSYRKPKSLEAAIDNLKKFLHMVKR